MNLQPAALGTTDFFAHQDRARQSTTQLIFLFGLAIFAIAATLYGLLVVVQGYGGQNPYTGATVWSIVWWDPQLLTTVVMGTLLVVGGGSLYKTAQLRGGGRSVAESLGGRVLQPNSTDPLERRVLNVVEEMAIAAGIPVPPVYLLSAESGINAFAAGFTPDDAVIGVTRGCVEQLSRDELQGVIAHEFSHILNGDMRLNLRLIGVLHGILLLGILGYFLLRTSLFAGAGRRRDSRDQSGLMLLALGFGLVVAGFLGSFFGGWIKAAVSRQREFLADASAVQFTRNPSGIAGALKKIGGFTNGARLASPAAPEASHLFFGEALPMGFQSLFATHPPLADRIRQIDPSWSGEFVEEAGPASSTEAGAGNALANAEVSGLAGAMDNGAFARVTTLQGVDRIGQLGTAEIQFARDLLHALPIPIGDAAREPHGARALVYCLLINRDASARETQLQTLARQADPGVEAEVYKLLPTVERLNANIRLSVIDLALPALRLLTRSQYETFKGNVRSLVEADHRVELFEWTLQRVLLSSLGDAFDGPGRRPVRHRSLESLRVDLQLVLSALAHLDSKQGTGQKRAFDLAAAELEATRMTLVSPKDCGLREVDRALSSLATAAPRLKQQILRACALCVCADGKVNPREAELLRAIAASLHCPMPPLLDD